jgi:eukaryotic-like serine/threonine-protein kinase
MMLETQPTEVQGHIDAEPERLRPGMSIDHFRVIRFLDRGAMGEVYLARDMKLGRKVALKLIPVSRLRSAEAVRDFLFEAKATARFNHPNIRT